MIYVCFKSQDTNTMEGEIVNLAEVVEFPEVSKKVIENLNHMKSDWFWGTWQLIW